MIIEFLGFPGSGKTTISNQLIKTIEKEGYTVIRGTFDHKGSLVRISLKALYSTACLFISPWFYFKSFTFFLRFGLKMHLKDFLNISYLFARYTIYKDSKKIVVFDQGLSQAYYSLACFHRRYKKFPYDLIFDKTRHIICLELTLTLNKERLEKRGQDKSRVEAKPEVNFDFYQNQLDKIIRMINQHYPDKISLSLDAKRAVKQNVRKIIETII